MTPNFLLGQAMIAFHLEAAYLRRGVIVCAVSFVLNVLFIRFAGISGAAAAMALTELTLLILLAQKLLSGSDAGNKFPERLLPKSLRVHSGCRPGDENRQGGLLSRRPPILPIAMPVRTTSLSAKYSAFRASTSVLGFLRSLFMSKRVPSVFLLASGVVTFGNACGYVLQFLLARGLSQADFGTCNSILALSIILVAPSAVAPLVISRLLIEHGRTPEAFAALARATLFYSLTIAALFFGVYLFFADWIQASIHVPSALARFFLPALVISTFLYHWPIGVWQAKRDYAQMSLGTAGVPILRCVGVLLLVTLAGGGIVGALVALISGGVAVFLIGIWIQVPLMAGPGVATDVTARGVFAITAPASFATLCLLSLAYIDLPIVRTLVSPEASGLYAAAATIAKIALLLPQALVNIVFPEAASLSRSNADGARESWRLIRSAIAFTVVVSGGAALMMIALPQTMLEILAGKAYGAAAPLLQVLAPAAALLAVITLIVTYAIARNAYILLVPAALTISLLVWLPVHMHTDSLGVAWLLLELLAALAATCFVWLIVTHRRIPTVHVGL